MSMLTQAIAFIRYFSLNSEYKFVERELAGLNPLDRRLLAGLAVKELQLAGQSEFPHLYGTDGDQRYRMWGNATLVGLDRAKSDNSHIKLRGIALWLAVAFYETKDSPFAGHQTLHRKLMRSLRELKESLPKEQLAALAA